MSTPRDAEAALLRLADELSGRAMLAEESVEERAGLLKTLGEIAVQAKIASLNKVVEATRALTRVVDQPGEAEAMTEGLAKLDAAIRGEIAPRMPGEDTPDLAAPDAEGPWASPPEGVKPAPPAWASDPELLAEFFVEAADHLTSIETQLLKLEQDPAAHDSINAIFRGFHTIKGLAGFLEFAEIQAVAHETETLLDLVRNGTLPATPKLIDVVLESADYLKRDLARVQETSAGAPARDAADNKALIRKVRERMSGDGETQPDSSPAAEPPSAAEPARKEEPQEAAASPEHRKTAAVESRLVKVDTAKLDFLVDMVGELVISQSLIRHDGELHAAANPKLQRNLSQLARITADVQKTAMSMRMVQVGQLFQKSARLVRDLTRKAGKQAELALEGEETELDRTIIEQLADPLMHMIRNSADHGIETPEERVAAGKPATAKISLKAYHQSGHIVIEIGDDGRGLNREKILHKARERGLVQEGTTLTDKEVFNLIFEPGFSTADKVTDVSGRGVGMDVVRKHVQKLRGGIDIQSRPGLGTTFFLKLPLTLAIIDGLVVSAAGERYILPDLRRPRDLPAQAGGSASPWRAATRWCWSGRT